MKFLITLVLSIICGAAYSAPMSEDISICYKVIKKSSCIVSSGYGAVGSLLEAPKDYATRSIDPKSDIATDSLSKIESNYDGLTTGQEENKRIAVQEHVEPEPPKRGWLSRFFLPNG